MRLRIPDIYQNFRCLAGACENSCCIGWELTIDPETYEYYKSIEGTFGDRLRAHMEMMTPDEDPADNEIASFGLVVDGRCPFLNKENLCDIVIELGEEALCTVCTEYPRWTARLGQTVEKSLTVSCEEAARLVFFREDPLSFTEVETTPGSADHASKDEPDPEELLIANIIYDVREVLFDILKNKKDPLDKRIETYLSFCKKAQNILNAAEEITKDTAAKIRALCSAGIEEGDGSEEETPAAASSLTAPSYESFKERLGILSEAEIINDEWEETFNDLKTAFTENTYAESANAAAAADPFADHDAMQYLLYMTFRYFPRAAFDFDLLGKARFSVFMLLALRDLDTLMFKRNGGTVPRKTRILTAGILAREIEHSEYNIETVLEELMFAEYI